MRYMTSITLIALVFGCGFTFAQSIGSCPVIGAGERPALVYSENAYSWEENKIFVAHKSGGAWQTKLILSAIYVAVEQLEGGKFLLTSGSSSQNCLLYSIDFDTGSVKPLTSRHGFNPTRFETRLGRQGERFVVNHEMGKAFLIQDARDASDLEFITFDYRSMTHDTKLIPKNYFRVPFNNGVRMKTAPDGKHIAFLHDIKRPGDSPFALRYALKILRPGDLNTVVGDEDVRVNLSPSARTPFAWPEFSWNGPGTVVYEHMEKDPGGNPNQALVIQKSLDIAPNSVKELGRSVKPLSAEPAPSAGSMAGSAGDTGPLRLQTASGNVTVSGGGKTLFQGPHFAGQILSIASLSGRNFAYSLSTPPETQDKARKSDLYVNVDGGPAERIGDTIYYRKPLAWIE